MHLGSFVKWLYTSIIGRIRRKVDEICTQIHAGWWDESTHTNERIHRWGTLPESSCAHALDDLAPFFPDVQNPQHMSPGIHLKCPSGGLRGKPTRNAFKIYHFAYFCSLFCILHYCQHVFYFGIGFSFRTGTAAGTAVQHTVQNSVISAHESFKFLQILQQAYFANFFSRR